MCGIAGIVNLTGSTAIDPEIVRRMADAIFHRGPDEDGYFFRPGLAMANRRLSIIGLADGRQPMHNEDRSVSVVFNGELFDYPEVRTELIAKGHQFRTHCDTELIPHLWEEHGEGMLERLRGQFAIALWDGPQRLLVLARDRFGICPLTGHGRSSPRAKCSCSPPRSRHCSRRAWFRRAPIRVASIMSSPSLPCRDR
jgi:asparagine synthase (glutamine-hydrolysing)